MAPGMDTLAEFAFAKWMFHGRRARSPNVPTRQEAQALQTKLRETLLAKMFPEVAPELMTPLTGLEKQWDQLESCVLPVTITSVWLRWPKPRLAGRLGTHIELMARDGTSRIAKSISHSYTAGWPDMFWLGVVMILERDGDRIRRCGECHKLFAIRTRRQEYCSDSCSLRGRQRKWIKTHPDETKKRRAAAYAKQLKKRTYSRVKVQRRSSAKQSR
jgi:hypothetical protein